MFKRSLPYIIMACIYMATNVLVPTGTAQAEFSDTQIQNIPWPTFEQAPVSTVRLEPDEYSHINPNTPAQEMPVPAFYRGKWTRGEYIDNGKIVNGWWVPVIATAYSPMDRLTRDDENNPLRKTSKGVRSTKVQFGIAIPPVRMPYNCEIIVPHGNHYEDYNGGTKFKADDTGPIIRDNTAATGIIHIDLRYWKVSDAKNYNKGAGRKSFCIFVIDEAGKYAKFASKSR